MLSFGYNIYQYNQEDDCECIEQEDYVYCMMRWKETINSFSQSNDRLKECVDVLKLLKGGE